MLGNNNNNDNNYKQEGQNQGFVEQDGMKHQHYSFKDINIIQECNTDRLQQQQQQLESYHDEEEQSKQEQEEQFSSFQNKQQQINNQINDPKNNHHHEINQENSIKKPITVPSINYRNTKNVQFPYGSIEDKFLKLLKSQQFRYLLIISSVLEITAYLMHDFSYRNNHDIAKLDMKVNQISSVLELITNIIFTIEMLILALLCFKNKTFLIQSFTPLNILLLLVLISSWLTYGDGVDIEVFHVIKNFRILTIFRLFPELEKKVNAFFGSFKHLGKTFFPLICIILFYAVVGISLFRGHTESRCRLTPEPDLHEQVWELDESYHLTCGSLECREGTYCGNPADYNLPKHKEESDNELLFWGFVDFDNIWNALFSVYNFLMVNGWISTTNIYWRAQEKTVSAIYFASLVLLLSQIFSNIVLATLYEGFMASNQMKNIKEGGESNQTSSRSAVVNVPEGQTKGNATATNHQNTIFKKSHKKTTKFIQQIQHSNDVNKNQNLKKKGIFQMIILSQISHIQGEEKANNFSHISLSVCYFKIKQTIKSFQKSNFFCFLIFLNITGAMLVICLDRLDLNSVEYEKLNIADFILTMIFFGLSFIELLGMGYKKYFSNNLLVVDFLIIISHIVSYSIETHISHDIFIPSNQYFTFIRWTKMLRSLRLFHDYQIFGSLKILMRTYYQTLKSLPEFFIVWGILILLFAQIGRQLLAGKIHHKEGGEAEEEIRINYDDLESSIIAVIMICFNEEWHLVMYKYRKVVGYKSILFHLFAMLILQVLFVRLFIGIFISIFMKWLRENEILLYNSQTTTVIAKAWNQFYSYLFAKKQQIQVRPSSDDDQEEDENLQVLQDQIITAQTPQDRNKEFNKENGIINHQNFSESNENLNLQQQNKNITNNNKNNINNKHNNNNNVNNINQTNIFKKSEESENLSQNNKQKTLFMKRLNNQTKNNHEKSSHQNPVNITLQDRQQNKLDTPRRKSSQQYQSNSFNPIHNNTIKKSKSNDNLVDSQKQQQQQQQSQQQQELKNNDENNINPIKLTHPFTQSQASTTNHQILSINYSSADKSIMNLEIIGKSGNDQTINTNQFILPTQDNQIHQNSHNNFIDSQLNDIRKRDNLFAVLENNQQKHYNNINENQCKVLNEIQNQSNKLQQTTNFPSISIQSPFNASFATPMLQKKDNNNKQVESPLKSKNILEKKQSDYEKLNIFSSDSLNRSSLQQNDGKNILKNNSSSQGADSDIKDNQKDSLKQLNQQKSEEESLKDESARSAQQQKLSEDCLNNNSNVDPHHLIHEEIEEVEQMSVFLFSNENKIRILCQKIVVNNYFNNLNGLSIIALAILLAIDSPFVDPQSHKKKVINGISIFLTILFIIENIIQIIAHGFIFAKSSFIQRNWIFNSIDILTTIASFFYSANIWERQIYYFKYPLIFRVSLLLSFLSQQVHEIQFAGKILVKCLPRMVRLICFAMLFLLISSALTTKLLKGAMNNCQFPEDDLKNNLVQTKQDCMDVGGDWIDSLYNFNNVVNSLQTLYMVQSSEGWITIMFATYDSTSINFQSHHKEKSLWVIFFIQFFFIANICILNMFVGLVVETQNEMIETEHKTKDLHKFQKEWLFIKESIYRLKPKPIIKIPVDKIRRFIFRHLIDGVSLKILFYAFTITNCISFLCFENRQSQEEIDNLYYVNEVCLVAMIIEILCRFMCLEVVFFQYPWNIWDIITMIMGWINLRQQQNNDFEMFANNLRILDGVAKGLQVLRFYRIMKHFVIVKKLFKSLQYAVSSIFGIFLVLIVFLYISVLLCMNLFPYLKPNKIINGYDVTFTDFFNSLFNLIRIITSEYWYAIASEAAMQQQPNHVCFTNIILYEDYQKYGKSACGQQASYYFFYGFYLVFTLVILNIFIATIIESYKEAFSADESAVNHYQLDSVLQLWQSYDPEGKGYISYKEFWQFSSQIAIIYGVHSEELHDISNKNEFLKTLNIPIFEDPINRIFCYKFHDVVISLSKISVQIKYGITTLEPQDLTLRNQLDSQIKKTALKGDNMIKKTDLTSADMVLIIVLTRKVKQWKQKSLSKDNDFVFDIKQLTNKLRNVISSQGLQKEEYQSSRSLNKSSENKIQEKDEDLIEESTPIHVNIKNNNNNNNNNHNTSILQKPSIHQNKDQFKKQFNHHEKNVKFIEQYENHPNHTEDEFLDQQGKDDRRNQNFMLDTEGKEGSTTSLPDPYQKGLISNNNINNNSQTEGSSLCRSKRDNNNNKHDITHRSNNGNNYQTLDMLYNQNMNKSNLHEESLSIDKGDQKSSDSQRRNNKKQYSNGQLYNKQQQQQLLQQQQQQFQQQEQQLYEQKQQFQQEQQEFYQQKQQFQQSQEQQYYQQQQQFQQQQGQEFYQNKQQMQQYYPQQSQQNQQQQQSSQLNDISMQQYRIPNNNNNNNNINNNIPLEPQQQQDQQQQDQQEQPKQKQHSHKKQKKSKKLNKFSLPDEIKADSVLHGSPINNNNNKSNNNNQLEDDDYGLNINFNNNFILAFNDDKTIENNSLNNSNN